MPRWGLRYRNRPLGLAGRRHPLSALGQGASTLSSGNANQALLRNPMRKDGNSVTIEAIARVVRLSSLHAWLVILAFVLAAILSAGYLARHFAITTDSKELLSSSLPWRQQEIMLDQAFPQSTNLIIAVVDGATPEAADDAADALVNALSPRTNVIRSIRRPDGGEFFARNGILFLSVDEVRDNASQLIKAEPFLGTLAADPTLRGVLRTLSQSLEGVRLGKTTLEDLSAASLFPIT